jgi:hypothetical protein
MLNDEQIAELSYEIDETLLKWAQKYQVGSLSLSSVMIARLIRLIQETGDMDELRSIMAIAINTNTDDRTRDNRVLQ